MQHFRLVFAFVLLLLWAPHSAFAQSSETASRDDSTVLLEEQKLGNQAANVFFLMTGQHEVEAEDIFSERFLNAVSADQLQAVFDQVQAQYGAVQSVHNVERTGTYRARVSFRFGTAIGSGNMILNPADPNRIEGLLLDEFLIIGDELEAIAQDLEALPGSLSVYFGSLDGTRPRLEINPDAQMAIGSTFKLYVLSALTREMMADNERYWDDVVFLDTLCVAPRCGPDGDGRSFPSGVTQSWPSPMPMTVQSLATLMISISDNTATDTLINYLGEERVVQEMIDSGHSAPERNQPFLTTRQMFALKANGEEAQEAYRTADLEQKYEIVWATEEQELYQDEVDAAFSSGPVALDIEWFASAHDLRRLLAYLPQDRYNIARQIMAINPSVSPSVQQHYGPIYYKGGSEPGVLNYTWLLRSVYGWEVLTMSWNNSDAVVDEAQFQSLAQRLLSLPPQAYEPTPPPNLLLAPEPNAP